MTPPTLETGAALLARTGDTPEREAAAADSRNRKRARVSREWFDAFEDGRP